MIGVTHVVGAGLAGLSAATEVVARGGAVALYESGPLAGGRCRSYFDRGLACRVDNGNHLLMSGNASAMAYLERIGARNSLGGPGEPSFAFMDFAEGDEWTFAPNMGRIPWWVLRKAGRIPGSRLRDYLGLIGLRAAKGEDTVAGLLERTTGSLYRRFLAPLAIAALNTKPEEALARLLWAVIEETLLRGGAACVPSFPRLGLSESFVDPALAWLKARGASVSFGRRLVAFDRGTDRVRALHFLDGTLPLGRDDRVVLAVPAWVAADLLPGIGAPDGFEAIVNLHFRTDLKAPAHWRTGGFVGIVGGAAEWVFAKPGVVSVTISAANHMLDMPNETLAPRVWDDVARALNANTTIPPVRVVREKRATIAATAAQERRRPGPRTAWPNLALAGDWTATGLPSTIEGAIRSGKTAVSSLLEAA